MFTNYALQGIKQVSDPDIVTIKKCHPEVIAAFFLLCKKMGYGWDALFSDPCPDLIISGYRDYSADPEVKHSPHNFALALDVLISNLNAHIPANQATVLDAQIKWITAAINTNLFNRGGFYPQQNTIHLDIADDAWMKEHNGTKFWVKFDAHYTDFSVLEEAVNFAKYKIGVKS
jgi:hypothetical protein